MMCWNIPRSTLSAFLVLATATLLLPVSQVNAQGGGGTVDPTISCTPQATRAEVSSLQTCCGGGCDEACTYLRTCVFRSRTSGALVPDDQLTPLVREHCCVKDAFSGGDPHFKTWTGEYYDYHGMCDLVLLDAPHALEGMGLTVHVRTEARFGYSYIKAAAVSVGSGDNRDTLQVGGYGAYLLNGVFGADLTDEQAFLAAFPISYEQKNKKNHVFRIELGNEQVLELKTFKDWVSISFENASAKDFSNSVGLMGHFFLGTKVARDGKTDLSHDLNAFGQDWQVRPDEPQLFQTTSQQEFGHCILPEELEETKSAQAGRRRLGEASAINQDDALAACEKFHSTEEGLTMCQYDVMASGDLEMAQAGAM